MMVGRIFLSFWLLIFCGVSGICQAPKTEGDLLVNGVLVLRFSVPLGNLTPSDRARLASEKIKSLPYWGEITVRASGQSRTLQIGEDVLFTVSAADAMANHVSVAELAKTWAGKLRDALGLPALRLSNHDCRLPAGQTQEIVVDGSEGEEASGSGADPLISRVTKNRQGFLIEALAPGVTTLTISSPSSRQYVHIRVVPYAVETSQNLATQVVGDPASADVVRGSIDYALKTKLKELAGATVTYKIPVVEPIRRGGSLDCPVMVSGISPDGAASKGVVHVRVSNLPTSRGPASFLWVSNNPETVKQSQSLFSASLKKDTNVRLLYHHMNGTMQDIYLRVEAVNESKTPAILCIIYGDSKPSLNPVRAGFEAASQFIHHWMSGSGDVVTLPPGEVLPISLRRLSPGETGSGLCQLRLIGGPEDILVRTDSMPPLPLEDKWANTIFTSAPWHEVGSHPFNMYDNLPCEANPHIYADPHVESSLHYGVGGRHGYYRIGQHPLSQIDQEGSLDGNFGVFDTIQTTLSNPSPSVHEVAIEFEASAGYAQGVFLIDGDFCATPMLKPKGTDRLAVIRLMPGETRIIKILTLPISGSSYPATLMVSPLIEPIRNPNPSSKLKSKP